MKKSIALLALSATLLVTGCQQGRNKFEDHFKEYSFKFEVAHEDIDAIYDGVNKNAIYLSSYEKIEQAYSKNSYVESSSVGKTKIDIKEDSSEPDSLIVESTVTSEESRVEYGVSYKNYNGTEATAFHKGSYIYETIESYVNDKSTKKKSSVSISESLKNYKKTYLKSLINLSTSGAANYYVCSDDSYAVVFSNIEKNVSAVQWGDKTKERIISRKNQAAFFISKDYKLTSCYWYSETKANYDSTTGEWFDSEQLSSRSYTSIKYKYEKRESASINSLVAAYNNFQTK